jgi:hypothetical protein
MSELGNYIELLLHHEIPKETKDLIATWIKEVEANLVSRPQQQAAYIPRQIGPVQAPSTLAAMARHGDISHVVPATDMPVEPVTQIAQTAATALALQETNKMRAGIKPPITSEGRPRKF